MTTAVRARASWVEEFVRDHCFGAGNHDGRPLTFGAELELLAFDARSCQVAPIFGGEGLACSLGVVREVARRLTWREAISDKGVPTFRSADGGALTFEPGGQLEYASAVHHSIDGVLAELRAVEERFRESAERAGIMLLACGVDPFNGADGAPLQLNAKRYRQMAQYLARIGPHGARMMRQTASLQINVGGIDARARWPIANALAPWLVALFANSSRYAGQSTGVASYRAETWRGVDRSRTGLFHGPDAVREYASFALAAPAFLAQEAAPPFSELDDAEVTEASLADHLSTLFPEVRPRGYLELRSLDAVDDARRRPAMALIAGVLGDETAARDAFDLIGSADSALLCRAARLGMRDERLASAAEDLVRIAIAGGRRLGGTIVSDESVSSLRALLDG